MRKSDEVSRQVSRTQLLRVLDVAAILNVKSRAIYEMVAPGRIHYRKPPGSNIPPFDLDEIVAIAKARKRIIP